MQKVKRTERGWGGHYILCDRCLFRRNTLLEYNDLKIVVSTVGLMRNIHNENPKTIEEKFDTVGCNRYYETMAFHAGNDEYLDADVSRQLNFESKWCINKIDAELEANDMHETVVEEISQKMAKGELNENQ